MQLLPGKLLAPIITELFNQMKKGGLGRPFGPDSNYAEKDEPQPQVDVAFGLRITN